MRDCSDRNGNMRKVSLSTKKYFRTIVECFIIAYLFVTFWSIIWGYIKFENETFRSTSHSKLITYEIYEKHTIPIIITYQLPLEKRGKIVLRNAYRNLRWNLIQQRTRSGNTRYQQSVIWYRSFETNLNQSIKHTHRKSEVLQNPGVKFQACKW